MRRSGSRAAQHRRAPSRLATQVRARSLPAPSPPSGRATLRWIALVRADPRIPLGDCRARPSSGGAAFGGGVGAARDLPALWRGVRDLRALRPRPRVLRRGVLGGGAPGVAAARTAAAPPQPGGPSRSPGSGSRTAAPPARSTGRTAAASIARGGSPFRRSVRARHRGAVRRRVGGRLGGSERSRRRRRTGGRSCFVCASRHSACSRPSGAALYVVSMSRPLSPRALAVPACAAPLSFTDLGAGLIEVRDDRG